LHSHTLYTSHKNKRTHTHTQTHRRKRAREAVEKSLALSGLERYAVRGAEEDWSAALVGGSGKRVSVKRARTAADKDYRGLEPETGGKRGAGSAKKGNKTKGKGRH
jgi:ABC-type polar amino acid transport system ATPase subunit